MNAKNTSTFVVLCLAATWFVWGSTYLAIKFALVSFPPFFQMGTRFLVAGGLLLAWVWYRGHPMPTLIQWRNALIIGTLMLGAGMGNTAYAELTIASGLVVAFIAVIPAIIALVNLPFGIKPSRTEIVGIVIGLVGVLLLVRGAGFSGSTAGLIAISIASVAWCVGSVLSQHTFQLAPGAVGFASEMLCGGVVLMAISLAMGEEFHWPPDPKATMAWVYLIIFGSLIAFSAYMVLLARTSAVLASSYTYVNPVIAMLLGIWLGGEVVTRYEWMAVGIIIVGVVMLVLAQGRKARATQAT